MISPLKKKKMKIFRSPRKFWMRAQILGVLRFRKSPQNSIWFPWLQVERVEIKDIRLPHQLMKSMAAEAEVERWENQAIQLYQNFIV